MPDYIAMRLEEEDDAEHYGVKGQRWGISRSSRELRNAAKTNPPAKQAAKKDESSGPAKKPSGNIQDNVESSSSRYDRLSGQAKAGRASDMSEQDLKFFNARTEALGKVAKLNETQPSWLRETTAKVVQQTAQRQMQSVADAIADKYIGDPIKQALSGAAGKAVTKAAPVAANAAKTDATPAKSVVDAAKKVAETVTTSDKSTSAPNPSTMRFADALQYYKDNPTANPVVPEGYSPNAGKVFMEELANLRKS